MATITLQGISKCFGQVTAISHLDLTVKQGERVVVLGRSGAGKTTLLRILCGLEQPDAGRVLLDAEDVTRMAPHSRNTALVTQDYALYPQQNVQQNLEAALSSTRLSAIDRQQRIAEALTWFGIAELVKRLPSQLSGGQLQRVALAKAIVRRPDLLVLDEPLSQIDAILRTEIRDLIRATVERFQTTLVMVTHDPLDALLLATKIAIVEGGTIIQTGEPQDVYCRPTQRIAAELLSPFGVNWLDWKSLKSFVLANPGNEALAKHSVLGIRPEHVGVQENQFKASECLAISAQVSNVQSSGFARIAQASVGNQNIRIIDPTQRLSVGPVQLFIQARHCIWL